MQELTSPALAVCIVLASSTAAAGVSQGVYRVSISAEPSVKLPGHGDLDSCGQETRKQLLEHYRSITIVFSGGDTLEVNDERWHNQGEERDQGGEARLVGVRPSSDDGLTVEIHFASKAAKATGVLIAGKVRGKTLICADAFALEGTFAAGGAVRH